jgi:hypothetical protein
VKSRPTRTLSAAFLAVILFGAAPYLLGYALENGTWPGSTIPVVVEIGPPSLTLQDGSLTYNSVVENAMALWNEQLANIQFTWEEAPPAPANNGDGKTTVTLEDTDHGHTFGRNALAVTTLLSTGSTTTQADIVFNKKYFTFDSYRGNLQTSPDMHRIALHELGHVLGLDHPDEAQPPQHVTAIMNSNTSDLDHLAADDINGGEFLYGRPAHPPSATGNGRAANISTRARVGSGNNVMIGGFIIHNASKQVLIRALGPSLASHGVSGVLADPLLELHNSAGDLITTNDNWRDSQEQAITATSLPPSHNLESAILATLAPGSYTAIVRGNNGGSGVALVEVYDLATSSGRIANVSTRGQVATGDNVMIGGFIIKGPQSVNVIVRGIGPSLASRIPQALPDTSLELHNSNGALMQSNTGWMNSPDSTEISSSGLAPTNSAESAIVAGLAPGNYTAILRSPSNSTGVGLIEVYDRD